MQKVDINAWPRKEIFDFFGSIADPFYMVSFDLPVTRLYRYAKENGLSFYHSMVWLVTRAVNSVEAFRYMFSAGELCLAPVRRPSFTHLDRGSELFRIITMPCEGDIASFCRAAAERASAQTAFIDPAAEGGDLIYVSCLPWLDMTALTNEHDVGTEETKLDSVPRVAWGRLKRQGEEMLLNISVEVNHRFIDGVHIGRFAERMEEIMREL